MSLAAAVPVMAGWKLSNLPKGLESDQLDRVLGGCDRLTPMGRRDYAVLLLLSRPGLCAGKIARLGLDDIDWAHGEITIVGNRSEKLPLASDVAKAIGVREPRSLGQRGGAHRVRTTPRVAAGVRHWRRDDDRV